MRLPADRIKQAILSPDEELREAVVDYFASSFSADPGLMPLVIQAVECFGPESLNLVRNAVDLAQTDESLTWLCEQLDQLDPAADSQSGDFFAAYAAMLRKADPELLKRHEAAIRRLPGLDQYSRKVIADRIELASLAPDELWQRLIEFCDEMELTQDFSDENFDFIVSLTDAVSRYPDRFADRVLDILDAPADESQELLALGIAGSMRLEAAIPCLAMHLAQWDNWTNLDAGFGLAKIGTDAVVSELAQRYGTGDTDSCEDFAALLGNIHTDLSVETCQRLLAGEQDANLRAILIASVLRNFSPAGIEPAREFVLAEPKNPEVLDVRRALLVAAKMLGVGFPEFDAWLADSEHHAEFRGDGGPRPGRTLDVLRQKFGVNAIDEDFDDVADADDFAGADFAPIVRQDEKIGRNDPCPCGSGKKYKKCCLPKRVSQ